MPPTSTTSAQNKTMQIYNRVYDEAEEDALDKKIIQLPAPESGDIDTVAEYLSIVLFRSRDLVNRKYLDLDACKKLVQGNDAFVELLFGCIKEKSFVKLRNLVIFKPTKSADTVEDVQAAYSELFERLSIIVRSRSRFVKEDVPANNAEVYSDSMEPIGHSNTTIPNQRSARARHSRARRGRGTQTTRLHPTPSLQDSIPSDIQALQDALGKLRTYSETTPSEDRNLASSRYTEQFRLMFQPSDNKDKVTVESDREYAYLFWLHHSYLKDSVRAAKASSSAFKASTFCGSFIHPAAYYPFLDSTQLAYGEDVSWGFPLFIINQVWMKYTPRSDWSVAIKDVCPLIISEVVSQKDESDEFRMLLQAIAFSRAGNYLMKPSSDKNFFLVAIYLADNLEVHRYIIKPESKEPRAKVNIVRKIFNLQQPEASTLFLLEMFNLLHEMQSLAKDVDPEKKSDLAALAQKARNMLSFTAFRTVTTHKKTLDDIPEDNGSSRFHSSNVCRVLDEYDYEVGIIHCFHPNIARVYEKGTDNAVEFLKFIQEESNELRILYHLANLDSPHNHAIRPIRMWSVKGGTMVSLPYAGQCISASTRISEGLWGIVRQLFEAIRFLHDNNIAHLDIKPPNIMISETDGRLTLIDFEVSTQIKYEDQLVKGKVGTMGYIAPEVESWHWYSPVRADLYSSGIVIKELGEKAEDPVARIALLTISARLTDLDPEKRPMMSEVLRWLDSASFEGTPATVPTTLDVLPAPIAV